MNIEAKLDKRIDNIWVHLQYCACKGLQEKRSTVLCIFVTQQFLCED